MQAPPRPAISGSVVDEENPQSAQAVARYTPVPLEDEGRRRRTKGGKESEHEPLGARSDMKNGSEIR